MEGVTYHVLGTLRKCCGDNSENIQKRFNEQNKALHVRYKLSSFLSRPLPHNDVNLQNSKF